MNIPDHFIHRILHLLRDVELAVEATQRHDNNAGIEAVAERVGILRLVIVKAIEKATR